MLTARFLKGENSTCIDILLTLLEKLPRFEQNISENDVFSNTFVYRRFKCSNTFIQQLIYRDNIHYNPTYCSYRISLRELQSGIHDCLLAFLIQFSKNCVTSLIWMKDLFQFNLTWQKISFIFQVFLWKHMCPQKLMTNHQQYFKSLKIIMLKP